MSITGVEAFDSTLHLTNTWLNEVMKGLAWTDRHRAYAALRATLHALRDRLSPDEAAHLGAQLPMLVRGFYFEGWHPAGKPRKERHKDDFLAHIDVAFRNDPDIDAEAVARAVFAVIGKHVSPGEVRDIVGSLPAEIRALWPEA
ncbi:MAG TPA: DUF2267 domain-containing protein [Alphaproteobacteria bacterium]|nr:DUF2267 domain-containing protein [Alphaproteobacteria bacterium]